MTDKYDVAWNDEEKKILDAVKELGDLNESDLVGALTGGALNRRVRTRTGMAPARVYSIKDRKKK